MRAFAVALVVLCGCVELGGGYRVVPPPPAHSMQATDALGYWVSNFGDVTIEVDEARGGLATGAVLGTWSYFNPQLMRETRGRFHGTLRGSVLRLVWSEGAATGHGFLEFSPRGDSYSGQWWTQGRSKTGNWRGWRGSRGAV